MRANLELTRGADHGRGGDDGARPRSSATSAPTTLVSAACAAGRRARGARLADVLAEEPDVAAHLGADELDRLLDPAAYLGLLRRRGGRGCRHREARGR